MTYVYEINIAKPSFVPGFPPMDFVQGTITTDCINCILAAPDIVDWNLSVTVHALPTETLNMLNSTLKFPSVNDLVATPTGLYFDFNTVSWFPMWFMNDSNGTVFELGSNPATIAWQIGNTAVVMTPGNDLIATYYGVAAVPEPATWLLLLLGFALLGRAGRSWKPRPALAARPTVRANAQQPTTI